MLLPFIALKQATVFIMSFLGKIFGGSGAAAPASRAIAKDRLSVMLSSQRGSELLEGVNMEEMQRLIGLGDEADAIWVDVRAPNRFLGQVEEPRPGMRLGHMPGAKNIFFKDLLDPDNVLQFKPKEELERIISEGGVDLSTKKRIIVSCGSGATACALIAALDLCGKSPDQCYVYDGSWSEWGSVPNTPIVKDADK
mgnify:CR=1 FL=1